MTATSEFAPLPLADHFLLSSSSSSYCDPFLSHKAELPSFQSDSNAEYNFDVSYDELEWTLKKVQGGPFLLLIRNLPILSNYNSIWNQGGISDSLKEGLVIPIPKPDKDCQRADSFRPVALHNCIGNILKKMVNRRLISLLESHGLLDNRQFAFRPNKSIDDYLTEFEDIIDSHLEAGRHGNVVSLDISKVYDRAWRFSILKSLEEWEIKGRMGR